MADHSHPQAIESVSELWRRPAEQVIDTALKADPATAALPSIRISDPRLLAMDFEISDDNNLMVSGGSRELGTAELREAVETAERYYAYYPEFLYDVLNAERRDKCPGILQNTLDATHRTAVKTLIFATERAGINGSDIDISATLCRERSAQLLAQAPPRPIHWLEASAAVLTATERQAVLSAQARLVRLGARLRMAADLSGGSQNAVKADDVSTQPIDHAKTAVLTQSTPQELPSPIRKNSTEADRALALKMLAEDPSLTNIELASRINRPPHFFSRPPKFAEQLRRMRDFSRRDRQRAAGRDPRTGRIDAVDFDTSTEE